MRRKPKENNFKAVLETIRELMNTECVVPDWLHDIILGYGDPGAAHYSRSVLLLVSIQTCLSLFLVKMLGNVNTLPNVLQRSVKELNRKWSSTFRIHVIISVYFGLEG